MTELPTFITLSQIIGDPKAVPPVLPILPISRSTWQKGVKAGRYPKPVQLSPNRVAWRAADINALIQQLSNPQA